MIYQYLTKRMMWKIFLIILYDIVYFRIVVEDFPQK
nr:MAG TPA: hypothetical protein [Caudoviricetes sp.]